MAEVATWDVEARARAGTGGARETRRQGMVPAIVYGAGEEPAMIAVSPKELARELRNPGFFGKLFDLKLSGKAERVIPKDVQFHPVSDEPLHIDFLRVSADSRVTVAVPVQFQNEEDSPGLRSGGVLNIVRHEVELNCRVDAIPQVLEIDLTGLEVGDSVHISAVSLGDGVEPVISDRDFTIATIAAPTIVADVDETEGEDEGEDEAAAEDTGDEDDGED